MSKNNINKSINQISGILSEDKSTNGSYLVRRCTQLCNIPISQFEYEDYRILISQEIALEYIIPPAIDILCQNLFAEGDYYQGDLLKSVLTIDKSFWINHPKHAKLLKEACLANFGKIDTIEISNEIKENLMQLVSRFLNN